MYPVVMGLVEPEVPHCCHLVADREVGFREGKGFAFYPTAVRVCTEWSESPKTDK